MFTARNILKERGCVLQHPIRLVGRAPMTLNPITRKRTRIMSSATGIQISRQTMRMIPMGLSLAGRETVEPTRQKCAELQETYFFKRIVLLREISVEGSTGKAVLSSAKQ